MHLLYTQSRVETPVDGAEGGKEEQAGIGGPLGAHQRLLVAVWRMTGCALWVNTADSVQPQFPHLYNGRVY